MWLSSITIGYTRGHFFDATSRAENTRIYSIYSTRRGYIEQKIYEFMRTIWGLVRSWLGNADVSGDYFLYCKIFDLYFKASCLY